MERYSPNTWLSSWFGDTPIHTLEQDDAPESVEQSWIGRIFGRCLSTTRALCRLLISPLSDRRNQASPASVPVRRREPYPLPQEGDGKQTASLQKTGSTVNQKDNSPHDSPGCRQIDLHKTEDQLNPNAKLVDLTTIDFEDFLVPSRLPPGVATYIKDRIVQNQEEVIKVLTDKVKASSDGQHLEKLIKCVYVLSDIRRLIPAFSEIGRQLLKLSNQYHPDKPLEVTPVETFCEIHEDKIRERDKLPGLSMRERRVAREQKYRYIDRRKSTLPDVFSFDLMISALEQICSGGLSPRNAPIFLRFIKKEFANEWAIPHGFIESDSSSNYAHGEWSHLIQLASLNWMGILNPDCIELIIKNNLWNIFFDMNHYKSFYLDKLPGEGVEGNVCGFPMALLADSPTVIHQKLSTGQISSALEKILNSNKLETYLPELASTMDLVSLTKDDLQSMINSIRVLEMAIACRSLKNKEYVEEFRRYRALGCQVVMPGDFDGDSEMAIKASLHRAYQHFEQGDRVFGYYREMGYSTNSLCYRPILSEQDIEQCNAFVVIPKGSSRQPPSHVERSHR